MMDVELFSREAMVCFELYFFNSTFHISNFPDGIGISQTGSVFRRTIAHRIRHRAMEQIGHAQIPSLPVESLVHLRPETQVLRSPRAGEAGQNDCDDDIDVADDRVDVEIVRLPRGRHGR